MQKYFGNWKSADDVQRDFSVNREYHYGKPETYAPVPDFPKASEILLADYTYEDYSGSAYVLFERAGKLYEVVGSHCSCFGLEGQWKPEETTWAALAMRPKGGWKYSYIETPAAVVAFDRLVARHTAVVLP